jgi:hypothetical protein
MHRFQSFLASLQDYALLMGLAALGLPLAMEYFPHAKPGLGPMQVAVLLGGLLLVVVGSYRRQWRTTYPRLLSTLGLSVFTLLLSSAAGVLLIEAVYRPQPIVSGWRSQDTDPTHQNQLGFRGQPIEYTDEDFVVILLGDSQVEAICTPLEQMPEQFLQAALASRLQRPVRVFTLGSGGYGQDQQWLVLDEYLQQYRADWVIIWVTPTNDIWNNLFPTHYPRNTTPKPTFWLADGTLQGPSEALGAAISWWNTRPVELLWNRLFYKDELPLNRDYYWEQNHLPPPYRLVYNGPADDALQRLYDTATPGQPRSFQNEDFPSEKTHYSLYFTPRSPRMQYAIDLMQTLFTTMQERVAAQGGQLALFRTQVAGDAEQAEGIYRLNGEYYQLARTQYAENVAAMYAGFTLYSATIDHPAPRCEQDTHLNGAGNGEAMRELADQLPLPPAR